MASVGMVDLARTAITPIDKNVRYWTALNSPIMGDVRMRVIDTQSQKYIRFVDNYGTPAFGNLGEGFNSIVSKNEQLESTTYRVGFNIDVDRDLRTSDQVVDPRVMQLKAGMIGYGAFVSGKIFNADPANPGQGVAGKPAAPFKGLGWYLDFPDDREGAKLDRTMKIDSVAFNGGTTIDLRPPVSSANGRSFLRLLDRIRYTMWHAQAANKKITIYAPTEIMIALPDIMRITGAFKTTADQYGREVYDYGAQVEIKDAGLSNPTRSPLDPTTSVNRVLGWETIDGIRTDTLIPGAGNEYVSLVAVEHGEDAFMVFSKGGQKTQDLGLQPDGVTYRTQVSDMLGLAFYNPWCVSRAYGLLVA